MNLRCIAIEELPDKETLWDEAVSSSKDGWFWHTRANFAFNLCAAEKMEARDHSFFVFDGEKPLALVPLLTHKTKLGDYDGIEASYYGGPLPWPCFIDTGALQKELEDFTFKELERRAADAGAGRIHLIMSPAIPAGNEYERFSNIVFSHAFLDSGYYSHFMPVTPAALDGVRERYRRYVKKYSPLYEVSVLDGPAVDTEIEDAYFRLHVKDAGGQFRSRGSYARQMDLARRREAFVMSAKHKESGVLAGMLLVSFYKKAAYDNSVAVDPDHHQNYVSHLLKWNAISELVKRGAVSYELGIKAELPDLMRIPSRKNLGISNFKDGWARGSVKRVFVADKFLSQAHLAAFMKTTQDCLEGWFGEKHPS